MNSYPLIAQVNDYVLLKSNTDKDLFTILKNSGFLYIFSHIHQLFISRSSFIGKRHVKHNEIIGKLFGATYKITDNGKLERVDNTLTIDAEAIAQSYHCFFFFEPIPTSLLISKAFLERSGSPALQEQFDEAEPQQVPDVRDNRNLVDNSTAQRLDQDDIQKLKDRGAQAHEIVGALITSSKTFQGKTTFSQEKYIKKKLQKYFFTPLRSFIYIYQLSLFLYRHLRLITLLPVTISNLSFSFFHSSPDRISFISPSSVSLLLSFDLVT